MSKKNEGAGTYHAFATSEADMIGGRLARSAAVGAIDLNV